MIRISALLCLWVLWASVGLAQEFSALARLLPDENGFTDQGRDTVLDLNLSQGVPYRVFTLDNPARLVVDFQEVDWGGARGADLDQSDRIAKVQVGTYVPGWSRLVAELSAPMIVGAAQLTLTDDSRAHLGVTLTASEAAAFAAQTGAPYDARWDLPEPNLSAPPAPASDKLLVVLDPGHGGVDPGAETETVTEKFLMLTFARELREVLVRDGRFDVALTRTEDYFVSLERRIALAHQAGADAFLSLHADSLAEGLAHGATVHVLSREASDIASAKLAERQDRADLLSGIDLSDTDDEVTGILLDLARQETQPRTDLLARALVEGMAQTGGPMNRRPLRSASFSVLKAADIPSVLIEIGFISSPRDLVNLQNPEWRARMAKGIRNGLLAWAQADAAMRPLVRQ